ncbi:radical SAM protein [Candidatus Woesearchaeota archaeon]|nr:radical SAM protein [Candidatus Woesearchaeota archaeon]
MKILIIYAPFCAPTMMPYSLASMKHFVETHSDASVTCLDLNAYFHTLQFPEFYKRLKKEDYASVLEDFDKTSRAVYAENNKKIVHGEEAAFVPELMERILQEKADLVAFSFVYNSQCFYGHVLVDALLKRGIPCVLGGPAVTDKLHALAPVFSEKGLLDYLVTKGVVLKEIKNYVAVPDFSPFPKENYLSKERIISLKSSSTCFYKQCTFCTHFARVPYAEYSLEHIREALVKNKAKYVYFIDDMISKNRLLEIGKLMEEFSVQWWCQLRPTEDLLDCLELLSQQGLRSVCWGVESGNQRILDLMKKGTSVEGAKKVLAESKRVGIINMLYMLFAFPTETKEEFLASIDFLEKNKKNIDLVSTSVFGLQRGAKVYDDPQAYGILAVSERERTLLPGVISYTVEKGLDNEEARILLKNHVKQIKRLEKLPHVFNYFKEQTLLWKSS